jgi:hypothetical protein
MMSHVAYSPVGYIYRADNYCLDCIATVVAGRRGTRPGHCNCAECRLDRIAEQRGIDRYDERSFDSGDFPKAIPYHNDLHAECGPEGYGYGPEDPEWQEQYCNATCAKCGDVIDGCSQLSGPDLCPAFEYRKANSL